MALQLRGMSVDELLMALTARFVGLQSELQGLQSRCKSLGEHHGRHCSISLNEALVQLFKVIKYVNKADKALIHWHGRSNGLKTALSLVGMNRRTQAIIDKKNEKLKKKLSLTEKKFNDTGDVFHEGLEAVKVLNTEFSHFSVDSIGSTSRQAQLVCDRYDTKCTTIKKTISGQQEASTKARADLEATQNNLQVATSNRESAQGWRDSYSTVSSLVNCDMHLV